MPRDAAEILKDALALPLETRAALIGPLLDSLDTEVDEDVEEAWREKIGQHFPQLPRITFVTNADFNIIMIKSVDS